MSFSFLKSKYFAWTLLSLPAVPMLATLLVSGDTEELLHVSGEFSARFMIVAMIASPFRVIFNKRRWPLWFIRNRRYFGVAAFGYAAIHLLAYLVDLNSWALIVKQISEFGIWTGWAALALFVPLTITSNDYSMRVMRRAWKPLQRLVYPAAVLTLLHWVFVHYELGGALVHFLPLAALEAYRIYLTRKRKSS